MKITVLEVPGKDVHDALQKRTFIRDDDNGIVIEVLGFGTAEAVFRVRKTEARNEEFDPMAVIRDALCVTGVAENSDGYLDIAVLGAGFVLMEPITWAFAIRDIILNS